MGMIDKDLKDLITSSQMKSGNNWGCGMILVHPQTRKILLAKRSDTKEWCSPGGKVEIGESPLQGVIRETQEESGIKVNTCNFYSYEMHVAPNGKNWTSFMFISDDFDESTLKAQESEIDGDWEWFSIEEAMSLELFPPSRKGLERAIEKDVIYMDHKSDDEIPYIECPTSSAGVSYAKDSCVCAYSFCPEDSIFGKSEEIVSTAGIPIWD